jgi:uncharacterized protein (TIGR02611 family)
MDGLKQYWRKLPRPIRRSVVLAIGLIFIVAGAFMLVLPGPGWATIFLGLAILATEFERAERLHQNLIKRLKQTISRIRKNPKQ